MPSRAMVVVWAIGSGGVRWGDAGCCAPHLPLECKLPHLFMKHVVLPSHRQSAPPPPGGQLMQCISQDMKLPASASVGVPTVNALGRPSLPYLAILHRVRWRTSATVWGQTGIPQPAAAAGAPPVVATRSTAVQHLPQYCNSTVPPPPHTHTPHARGPQTAAAPPGAWRPGGAGRAAPTQAPRLRGHCSARGGGGAQQARHVRMSIYTSMSWLDAQRHFANSVRCGDVGSYWEPGNGKPGCHLRRTAHDGPVPHARPRCRPRLWRCPDGPAPAPAPARPNPTLQRLGGSRSVGA